LGMLTMASRRTMSRWHKQEMWRSTTTQFFGISRGNGSGRDATSHQRLDRVTATTTSLSLAKLSSKFSLRHSRARRTYDERRTSKHSDFEIQTLIQNIWKMLSRPATLTYPCHNVRGQHARFKIIIENQCVVGVLLYANTGMNKLMSRYRSR
jgi:hypothetical protein